jgi:hypothetical protein
MASASDVGLGMKLLFGINAALDLLVLQGLDNLCYANQKIVLLFFLFDTVIKRVGNAARSIQLSATTILWELLLPTALCRHYRIGPA